MTALCTRCHAEPRYSGSELGERCLWPEPSSGDGAKGCAELAGRLWPEPEERYDGHVKLWMADNVATDNNGDIRLNAEDYAKVLRMIDEPRGPTPALLELLATTRGDPPPITPEIAAQLVDEGKAASAAYFERTRGAEDWRTRCAALECQLEEMAARVSEVERRLDVRGPCFSPGSSPPCSTVEEVAHQVEIATDQPGGDDPVDVDVPTGYWDRMCALLARAPILVDVDDPPARTRSSDLTPPKAQIAQEAAQEQDAGLAPSSEPDLVELTLAPEFPTRRRGLEDDGTRVAPLKPCSHRHPDGARWCIRPPHEDDQHEYPPARELPRGEFGKGRRT